jgi:hypothetical protein
MRRTDAQVRDAARALAATWPVPSRRASMIAARAEAAAEQRAQDQGCLSPGRSSA